jgi:hypothetical protein
MRIKKALLKRAFFWLSNYRKIWDSTFSFYRKSIDLGSTLLLKHIVNLGQEFYPQQFML